MKKVEILTSIDAATLQTKINEFLSDIDKKPEYPSSDTCVLHFQSTNIAHSCLIEYSKF